MPNISRGDRPGGLMVYLVSEGRHNEHAEPHLVAGDSSVMSWYDETELSREDALAIGRDLDAPRKLMGVEVAGGHVWHCSLSLAAAEGQLTDEQWAHIVNDFVDEMGFTESSGKAACRWVGVRHGVSTAGNDHVHLAVSLVREDGTKANVWNDRKSAQRVAGELEVKYGLTVLESRQAGVGVRGVTPAELSKAERKGLPEPERVTLGRQVRGYAAASADEAEFVRRCRRGGLLIRPRYASDRTDVVTGYSAASRPPAGERPVWFGGGHLARDLTLPRLRAEWPDTAQDATAAVVEWSAAKRDRPLVAPGREAGDVDPAVWKKCTDEVTALRERLRSVPVGDAAAWAQVAKDTSGVFAAWSIQVEATPGPLAQTSDALARFSQVRAYRVPVKRVPQPGVRDAAMLLMQATAAPGSAKSMALLLHQLSGTLKALHDYQVASSQVQASRQVRAVAEGQLLQLARDLPAVEVKTTRRTGDERGGQRTAADRLGAPGQLPRGPALRPPAAAPLPSQDPTRAGRTPSGGNPRPGDDPGQSPGRRR